MSFIKSFIEINLWLFDIHLKIVYINFLLIFDKCFDSNDFSQNPKNEYIFIFWSHLRIICMMKSNCQFIFPSVTDDHFKWTGRNQWFKKWISLDNCWFIVEKRQKSKDLIPMLCLILFDLDYFVEIKLSNQFSTPSSRIIHND